MKTKLLTLLSLLALLLVSTFALADGRPTGIRIGRLVSGGGTNVEIDVTVPNTNRTFDTFSSTVWLGNGWGLNDYLPYYSYQFYQFASTARNVPLPWAIDWGDGSYVGFATLFGTSGGPWTGTFAHTYAVPGSYTITVGDQVGTYAETFPLTSGNLITGDLRYVGFTTYFGGFATATNNYLTYGYHMALAVTATAAVNTGTGIPTLNIYGLLAMAFVLVGTGVLLYRKPQQA